MNEPKLPAMNDEPHPITIRWMLTDDSCAAFEFRLAWNLGCNPCHIFPVTAFDDYKAGRSLREAMENQLQQRREMFDPTCLLEPDPHDSRSNSAQSQGSQPDRDQLL